VRAPTGSEGVRVGLRIFFGLCMGGLVTFGDWGVTATILSELEITRFDRHPRLFPGLVMFAAAVLNAQIARGTDRVAERGLRAGLYWAAALDLVLAVVVAAFL
jgi:hypothetical protein